MVIINFYLMTYGFSRAKYHEKLYADMVRDWHGFYFMPRHDLVFTLMRIKLGTNYFLCHATDYFLRMEGKTVWHGICVAPRLRGLTSYPFDTPPH